MLRHHALKECVSHAFSGVAIPVKKEPSGLAHKDRKRPDGCALILWRGGKPLARDVTVCTTVVDSYLTAASYAAGAVAKQAADRKCLTYADLSVAYEFHQWQLRHTGHLAPRPFHSWWTWVVNFRNVLVNHLKYSFYSSGSVS